MKDTIVAISTPMGVGAISVVRLSGNKALEIVKKLTKHQDFKDRYATLCHVYDEKNEILDEVIVLFFANPRSYTCEVVCVIQCHGGV
ncbi:tRNA uridine-5-carboxymethylaminomethyl(34) synthesis GTPase MnmE, partial [Campylobacter lari]